MYDDANFHSTFFVDLLLCVLKAFHCMNTLVQKFFTTSLMLESHHYCNILGWMRRCCRLTRKFTSLLWASKGRNSEERKMKQSKLHFFAFHPKLEQSWTAKTTLSSRNNPRIQKVSSYSVGVVIFRLIPPSLEHEKKNSEKSKKINISRHERIIQPVKQ